uniref:Cytosol aminopeptidase domain-containing protein n=1 Tax=Hucho hucho TaxID=62062 RepID=A0A4W5QW87_9TELE
MLLIPAAAPEGTMGIVSTLGLVLGVYEREKEEDDSLHLTEAAAGVDRVLSGKLTELLKISGPGLKKGKSRIFYGLHEVIWEGSSVFLKMGGVLSVSKGSEEPPVFLELHYNGCPDNTHSPLLLVGKGITFDRYATHVTAVQSGGKPSCMGTASQGNTHTVENHPVWEQLHKVTHSGKPSCMGTVPYLKKGMSGRPTRTLVEFAAGLANQA